MQGGTKSSMRNRPRPTVSMCRRIPSSPSSRHDFILVMVPTRTGARQPFMLSRPARHTPNSRSPIMQSSTICL